MAGGQERILRRRIRSVESTKKITRAMELIAASQMVRAQGRIHGARPYVEGMERVLADVAEDGTLPARLMGVPESPENVIVVAVVSDRGLCGGYNAFVLRAAERLMRTGEAAGCSYQLTTAGKKAAGYFRFRDRRVDHAVSMSDRPSYEDAREIAATIVAPFLSGEADLVQLVSTRFISAGSQVVETRQILPILPPGGYSTHPRPVPIVTSADADGDAETSPAAPAATVGEGGQRAGFFEYEPSSNELLALLVPRYAEAAIFQALLEASASEHIARQRAMSAATDNADELIKTLRRVMNRVRQDSITTEIMEIVGGAEALRQGSKEQTTPAPHDHYDAEERIA
ncbi:MAG TPA: ATP synthase F1 subunit gamma [Acidimicrobiales bacterium]|nr:ATP synthase F1 subunit gamma [Acidimicrobiales bacterium]